MKPRLLTLALVFGAAQLRASTVDLTPRYLDTEFDGLAIRQLYFLDRSTKIGITLDQETTVTAGGGGVLFKFPKVPDASFRILTSSLTPDVPMTEAESLEGYRAAALSFVPAGATEVKVLEETANPLPINRWQSHVFVVSYHAAARAMKLSVTFVNVNPVSQLALVTHATPSTFADAADRSFQIIRSWHEIVPAKIAGREEN
jgi:hypothetical protein